MPQRLASQFAVLSRQADPEGRRLAQTHLNSAVYLLTQAMNELNIGYVYAEASPDLQDLIALLRSAVRHALTVAGSEP